MGIGGYGSSALDALYLVTFPDDFYIQMQDGDVIYISTNFDPSQHSAHPGVDHLLNIYLSLRSPVGW